MTPFRMPSSGSDESRYNTIHSKTRNIVERTIGVLKNTFRCLLSSRGLHYRPSKATKIVNVCCALYNINREFKAAFPEEPSDVQDVNSNNTPASNIGNARDIRNNLMRRMFCE